MFNKGIKFVLQQRNSKTNMCILQNGIKRQLCVQHDKKRILRLIVLQQINKRKLSLKYKINSKAFSPKHKTLKNLEFK